MTRNYTPPNQLPNLEQWAAARETNLAVATAIHAIADDKRTPDAIWQEPTIAEVDHVMMALDEYISHGDFPAEDDGRYIWGSLAITLPASYHCIFGREPGSNIDFFGRAASKEHAALLLAEIIGRDDVGINEIMEGSHIIELSDAEAEEVQVWLDRDMPADECPTCILVV